MLIATKIIRVVHIRAWIFFVIIHILIIMKILIMVQPKQRHQLPLFLVYGHGKKTLEKRMPGKLKSKVHKRLEENMSRTLGQDII